MEKECKTIQCIAESTLRKVLSKANELEITKDDIIQIFTIGPQVYLVYYK